jgi:hypothetical protein
MEGADETEIVASTQVIRRSVGKDIAGEDIANIR